MDGSGSERRDASPTGEGIESPRLLRDLLARVLSRHKAVFHDEAAQVGGFMRLLMKSRNEGHDWSGEEREELKYHLLRFSRRIPMLLIFLLPLGSLLLPILPEIMDRRKRRRLAEAATAELRSAQEP